MCFNSKQYSWKQYSYIVTTDSGIHDRQAGGGGDHVHVVQHPLVVDLLGTDHHVQQGPRVNIICICEVIFKLTGAGDHLFLVNNSGETSEQFSSNHTSMIIIIC